MLTRRIQMQLIVFVVVTLVAVSYVGARYAGLGSLVFNDDYEVTGHFANSGGIYQGAEVTYRGVKIGQVGPLTLTPDGVDVHLKISRDWDKIPADSLAVVANRSAVGEQFVELQPQADGGPYLKNGSAIERDRTAIPLATDQFLGDVSHTVNDVDQKALKTTVSSLGEGFAGTGQDLQQIVDTTTSFVKTAHDNIDLTTDLIKDSNTALKTQMDEDADIRSTSSDFKLFSDTLSGSNKDLIRLISSGSAAGEQLRVFLEDNKIDLGALLREAATTGKIVKQNLAGLKQVLVVYPNVVDSGYSVMGKDPATGLYNTHFGLIINTEKPCTKGYEGTKKHSPVTSPDDNDNYKMNTEAHCTEPISEGNARGVQNLSDRAPVATYDSTTGKVSWGTPGDTSGQVAAPSTYGQDSWRWLYLGPLSSGS